ncbi:NAD(P)/FAD-dependent oxidoreductase [Zooshikella sp. RANM57]|uniref:NAD(P)/FAD-dependent oxidoreductase n=1 Tax=Zooshikella sp. RANM57 TaxID=3425863 RepID=UPI003D6FF139
MSQDQHIIIIGSGISGLAVAWLLGQRYKVTLIEKNDYLGGHTNTIEVEEDNKLLAIDTGFIVYNQPNYPHLTQLFHHLDVQTQPTAMSFAASINDGELEYSGTNLNTLFGQRKNIINFSYWRMLREIVRFNQQAKQDLHKQIPIDITLNDYLEYHRFSLELQQQYLIPMAAAIWSCPDETMLAFPACSFLRFFANHGLLNINDRPQWRTVTHGSYQYIKALLQSFKGTVLTNNPVTKVHRHAQHIVVTTSKQQLCCDKVIFANHADEILPVLTNPTQEEQQILGAFNYQKNIAYLHSDQALMPKQQRVWSAWNYLKSRHNNAAQNSVSVTYWMNLLQQLTCKNNYFVSLNPLVPPKDSQIIRQITYHHPVFTVEALRAQLLLPTLQGKQNTWFCGSYCGYGFHEDGLQSALTVAHQLGCYAPWEQSQSVKQQ